MHKHRRNLSSGGSSIRGEELAGGPPGPLRKKHSEGDILDMANMSEESRSWLQSNDETDALPASLRFNMFDLTCIIFSMVTYTLDLGMDLYIAYIYYTGEWIGYFVLTLVFVILPAGTMTAFSLRWYVIDMDGQTISRPSCGRWVIRTIFLLLQLAPVLRYIDSLIYGIKSRKAAAKNDKAGQIKYYTFMVNEDADATLLRLFEAFMESAPQVTLQLYILIHHLDDEKGPFPDSRIQGLAIITSLVSLAWSLSSYHRSLRYSQPDKPNISYKGTILQFVWHLCSISARVFALGVFSATYPILIVPVCLAHWLAMLAWLIVQGNQACSNQCEEALFILVVAFIYIFTFFNIRDEPTRYKYLTFYLISFLENTILLFTWFLSPNIASPVDQFWVRVAGIVGDYALFFVGIISMLLYYLYFHPSLLEIGLSKSVSLEKDFPPAAPSHETYRPRAEFLTRRASLDQAQYPQPLTSSSNPSSRRNVTFAMDQRKCHDKATRSNSCGNSVESKEGIIGRDKSSEKTKKKAASSDVGAVVVDIDTNNVLQHETSNL